MNYYEELAIEPSAGQDEILKSHKRLTRILHPDLHPEPALRLLADIQMRRLNALVEVLSDPVQRRQYDHSLTEIGRNTRVNRWKLGAVIARIPRWIYVAGAFLLGVAVAYFPRTQAQGVSAPPGGGMRTSAVEAAGTPRESMAKGRAARPNRPAVRRLREPGAEGGVVGARVDTGPAGWAPEPAPTEVPTPLEATGPQSAVAEVREAPVTRARQGYGGSWLYTPPKSPTRNAAVYSPEYIEMKISEHEGALRGSYVARYRISDKPISPSVAFQFAGEIGDPPAALAWTGAGGRHGEVRLTLLGNSSMQVTWHVSGPVPADTLGGGTAVLVRREE